MHLAEYHDRNGPERVGIILTDGTIHELENKADDPFSQFRIDPSVLIALEDEIEATWHTHPHGYANLSVADYQTFLAWPQFFHYIVGNDTVICFSVKDNVVILHD